MDSIRGVWIGSVLHQERGKATVSGLGGDVQKRIALTATDFVRVGSMMKQLPANFYVALFHGSPKARFAGYREIGRTTLLQQGFDF